MSSPATLKDRWAITPEKIRRSVEIIVKLAAPERVLLFGSCARGDHGPESDVDLLVLEREVRDQRAEMVRLRRAILPLCFPADVLVATTEKFDYWADTPGNVYHVAAREGRVMYEATRASATLPA